MPCQPEFNVDEESQRVGEIGILEWICHLGFTHPHRESPEDIPFTTAVINQFVKGAHASLRNSGIILLSRPDLIVLIVVTESGKLGAVGVIGSWNGRGQMSTFNCQRSRRHACGKGQQSQISSQSSLTPTDPWGCPGDHGVPWSGTDKKPTKFALHLFEQTHSRSNEQKSNPNHKSRIMPSVSSQRWTSLKTSGSHEWRRSQVPLRKEHNTLLEFIPRIFLLALSFPKALWPFTWLKLFFTF